MPMSVTKAYASKLNLLHQSQILPTKQLQEFYFKVTNKTCSYRLEKLHAWAGCIISLSKGFLKFVSDFFEDSLWEKAT